MVDFRNLTSKKPAKLIEPLGLYETLDRASDKGPLRPAQEEVLSSWHATARGQRDVIIKLHTGQGKTLVGLLLLQSKLNEGIGPAVYLCPDRYLAAQTASQAQQFGIMVKTASDEADLPREFVNSECIYIATCQKLFNGLTKFGLGARGLQLGAVVLDDCHAVTDQIDEQCSISIPRDHDLYQQILSLYSPSLATQGAGTLEDIRSNAFGAVLKVPYWDSIAKHGDLLGLLALKSTDKAIKYAWPLVKDILETCEIYVGSEAIEIKPVAIPVDLFTSFDQAKHRIFMSATVTDDNFLITNLGVDPQAVQQPIVSRRETWSGEKMVLLPELIHHDLSREAILSHFAKPDKERKTGVVVLTPSSLVAKEWETNGATIANKDNLYPTVEALRRGECASTIAIANRYDGIDLPDNACRVLIIDGLPAGTSPSERYAENTSISGSQEKRRIFRRIEQGLGRSVRGEKDYSAIIIIGPRLISAIRTTSNLKLLSSQTRTQMEIGLKISDSASEDVSRRGMTPMQAFTALLGQLQHRDPAWKVFYTESMDEAGIQPVTPTDLELHITLRAVDQQIRHRQSAKAAAVLQDYVDRHKPPAEERGLLLERVAFLTFLSASKEKAYQIQESAHRHNRYVLLPPVQGSVTPLGSFEQADAVIGLVDTFADFHTIQLHVDEVLRNLTFGQRANTFEQALKRVGELIGADSTRPEKEYRSGPDNVWAFADGRVLVIECKSEVDVQRVEINKRELNQLLGSEAWAQERWSPRTLVPVIIIPGRMAARDAAASESCRLIREGSLRKLAAAVKDFYRQLEAAHSQAKLSRDVVDRLLTQTRLNFIGLTSTFLEPIQRYKEV